MVFRKGSLAEWGGGGGGTRKAYIFELFFCKKYLLVGASSMLWTGQWMSKSVSQ